ncbi:MAG: OmpA family protein [Rhodocyclaceae bacterium]|nr:OmpA family protein [Rhodocyclaceae bacterium]
MRSASFLRIARLVLPAVVLSACAPKSWVVLMPNEDGSTGRIIVTGETGQAEVAEAGVAASLDSPTPETFKVTPYRIEQTFGGALEAEPMAPAVFTLYFEVGGARLTAESEALLPAVLAEAASRDAADISIVGHTDTTGDPADNQALGLLRASFVRDALLAAGLRLDRISTESHGEGNLLVATPDDTPEAYNRRVEVVVR